MTAEWNSHLVSLRFRWVKKTYPSSSTNMHVIMFIIKDTFRQVALLNDNALPKPNSITFMTG